MMQKNSRLVYSTDGGRVNPEKQQQAHEPGDGVVRIRRETSGRKGKGVTTATGFDLEDRELNALAKKLKQLCGSGGSVKNRVIEIQGDHREKIKSALEKLGFAVKFSGG